MTMETPRKAETQQFLVFRAGGRRFGIPIERIQGAARPRRIIPLPGAPHDYAGLALVRGEPVGILDARIALGTGEAGAAARAGTPGARPLVILIENDPRGLLVEKIDAIQEIKMDQISPAPESARRLTGLVPDGEHFLGLVNLDTLLAGGRS